MSRTPLLIAFVAWIALLPAVLPAQESAELPVPPEWLGEWRLNVEGSQYVPGPPPYRRGRMKVDVIGDQVRFAYDLVLPRGGTQHMEWTGRFDGQDYMVQGVDDYVTYAYTPEGERTYTVVTKVDGRTIAVSKVEMSADGRTLTTTTGGRNPRGQEIVNTTVYEKVR